MPSRLDMPRLEQHLKALGSGTRLEIVRLLSTRECVPVEPAPGVDPRAVCGPNEVCLHSLAKCLGLSPATVSRHMAILRAAGMVSARRSGQWVHFSIHREALRDLGEQIIVLSLLEEVQISQRPAWGEL